MKERIDKRNGGVGISLKTVTLVDTLLHHLILLGVLLSLLNHSLDLLITETSLLFSRDLQDTVGINLKGDIDLRDSTRGRRNSGELELTEKMIVLRHGSFTLKDLNEHSRLVVLVRTEGLRFLGGNHRVTLDQFRHHTSDGLNSERKRSNIEKKNILGSSLGGSSENTTLNGSTVRHSLIGVDRFVGLLTVEEILEKRLNLGNTSGSTDKNDLVDLALGESSIGENTRD